MAKPTSLQKKKYKAPKFSVTNHYKKTNKATTTCLVVTLSCGLKGLACGGTVGEIGSEALRLDGVFCES